MDSPKYAACRDRTSLALDPACRHVPAGDCHVRTYSPGVRQYGKRTNGYSGKQIFDLNGYETSSEHRSRAFLPSTCVIWEETGEDFLHDWGWWSRTRR